MPIPDFVQIHKILHTWFAMRHTVISKAILGLAVMVGVLALANGVFMSGAPEHWYWLVPGVPDRGPFNQHFVRDIGFIYILIGAAFTCGAVYSRHRLWLWLMPTAWLVVHAIFHVWEVVVGICGPESLLEDFLGVTLPALLALGLTYSSYRDVTSD